MKNEVNKKIISIEYWLNSAEHDFVTMNGLYEIKRYSDSLFFGHMVLEKVLKALFVAVKNEESPRIHSLVRIVELAGVDFLKNDLLLLRVIDRFNIRARYPDVKLNFYKMCDEPYTLGQLKIIKRLYKKICQEVKRLK